MLAAVMGNGSTMTKQFAVKGTGLIFILALILYLTQVLPGHHHRYSDLPKQLLTITPSPASTVLCWLSTLHSFPRQSSLRVQFPLHLLQRLLLSLLRPQNVRLRPLHTTEPKLLSSLKRGPSRTSPHSSRI